MSDVVAIPGNRIRSFVERIEQIENEIKELNEAKKEVFSEAKGNTVDLGEAAVLGVSADIAQAGDPSVKGAQRETLALAVGGS